MVKQKSKVIDIVCFMISQFCKMEEEVGRDRDEEIFRGGETQSATKSGVQLLTTLDPIKCPSDTQRPQMVLKVRQHQNQLAKMPNSTSCSKERFP